MPARALHCLVIAAAALSVQPAQAQTPPAPCDLPASDVDPLSDRAGILAQYERLPRSCLHAIFTACSTASSQSLLDFGSAAVCSFGYEALLRQAFGGNFRALMAWWHTQRQDSVQ